MITAIEATVIMLGLMILAFIFLMICIDTYNKRIIDAIKLFPDEYIRLREMQINSKASFVDMFKFSYTSNGKNKKKKK